MSGETHKKIKRRSFRFTLNNYTEEDEKYLQELDCQYIVYGHEVAPTTGTKHLQGFLYFKNERYLDAVRKLRKWDVRTCEAGVDANVEYATKDKCDVYERGTRPTDKGGQKRTRGTEEWATAVQLAREGRIDDIDPELQTRFFHNYVAIEKRARTVQWTPTPLEDRGFYGKYGVYLWSKATGRGKTWIAETYYGKNDPKKCYVPEGYCEYWNGYEGQKYVCYEEFDRQMATEFGINKWKALLDRGPIQVRICKSGVITVRPHMVVFCSNYSPQEVFFGIWTHLERRMTVICFD